MTKTTQPAPNVLIQHSSLPTHPSQQQRFPIPPTGAPAVSQPMGPYANRMPNPHFSPSGPMPPRPMMGQHRQPHPRFLNPPQHPSATLQHPGPGQGPQMNTMDMPLQQSETAQSQHMRPTLSIPMTSKAPTHGHMVAPVSSTIDGMPPPVSNSLRPTVPHGYYPPSVGSSVVTASRSMAPGSIGSGATFAAQSLEELEKMNAVALSRNGKEGVQDVVNRVGELFFSLKNLDLPGAPQITGQAKPSKEQIVQQLTEKLARIEFLIERLCKIYSLLEEKENKYFGDKPKPVEIDYLQLITAEKTELDAEGQALLQERKGIKTELDEKNKTLSMLTSALRSVQWEAGALLNS